MITAIFALGVMVGAFCTLVGVLICETFRKNREDEERTQKSVQAASQPKAHYIGKEPGK